MPTQASETLSVSIDRPWREVYAYAADASNMPHWAAGLGADFHQEADHWTFTDPSGKPARLEVTPDNPFGILDHDVYPQGQTEPVHMAVRVMPNGDGAEVTILLLRPASMSDADHEKDRAAVQTDLETLKGILERR